MKKIKGALLRRNCMLGDLGRRLHLSEDLKGSGREGGGRGDQDGEHM